MKNANSSLNFNSYLSAQYHAIVTHMTIKAQFLNSVVRYAGDDPVAEELWSELEKSYSEKSRHYHTLDHLNKVLKELIPYRAKFANWDVIVFAIAYHDAIYFAIKSNNEEKSAALARDRLREIKFPPQGIDQCEQMILATKRHEVREPEINFFTDADLSILGSDKTTYNLYVRNVRKEYSIYPDFLYKPGRKKVLQHFLEMKRIFKTDEFADNFEVQARENIKNELAHI